MLKSIKRYQLVICIELAQRMLPPQSGPQSIKFLLCYVISIISCIFIIYYSIFLKGSIVKGTIPFEKKKSQVVEKIVSSNLLTQKIAH